MLPWNYKRGSKFFLPLHGKYVTTVILAAAYSCAAAAATHFLFSHYVQIGHTYTKYSIIELSMMERLETGV